MGRPIRYRLAFRVIEFSIDYTIFIDTTAASLLYSRISFEIYGIYVPAKLSPAIYSYVLLFTILTGEFAYLGKTV